MEMDVENRLVSTEYMPEDEGDNPLRPRALTEYIGQEKVKQNLSVFIDAAKIRGEALDHVLLYGPPGLGETTLAAIIATEMGVNFRITSGPALERPGDLAALLTNLDPGDVLFIDEIHRLSRTVEEILYPAMEDFAIDIINGKGQGAASIHLPLPRFTLIGATTRAGQLSAHIQAVVQHLFHIAIGHLGQLFAAVFRKYVAVPAPLIAVVCYVPLKGEIRVHSVFLRYVGWLLWSGYLWRRGRIGTGQDGILPFRG